MTASPHFWGPFSRLTCSRGRQRLESVHESCYAAISTHGRPPNTGSCAAAVVAPPTLRSGEQAQTAAKRRLRLLLAVVEAEVAVVGAPCAEAHH